MQQLFPLKAKNRLSLSAAHSSWNISTSPGFAIPDIRKRRDSARPNFFSVLFLREDVDEKEPVLSRVEPALFQRARKGKG